MYLFNKIGLFIVLSIFFDQSTNHYELAFKEIEKNIETISFIGNANACIRVSKEIVPERGVLNFFDSQEVDRILKNRIEASTIEETDSLEDQVRIQINEELQELSKCDDPVGIIYFSPLSEDNILIANVFRGNHFGKRYSEEITFGTSLVFMIEFNQNNEVVNIISQIIENN